MKGQPALVVGLVDAGSVLHQEGHHVNVVVYACLGREEGRGNVRRADRPSDSRCDSYRKSPATQLTGCHVVAELLGILEAGAIPNHLRIAGVLQIPRSIALPMKGGGRSAYRPVGRIKVLVK